MKHGVLPISSSFVLILYFLVTTGLLVDLFMSLETFFAFLKFVLGVSVVDTLIIHGSIMYHYG